MTIFAQLLGFSKMILPEEKLKHSYEI